MENIFVTIVCLAVLLFGTATMALESFNSMDTITDSLKAEESRSGVLRQTAISSVNSTTYDAGSKVDLYLENTGQVALHNYANWDLIIRYEDGRVQWIPYGSTAPCWSVSALYIDGRAEVFNPQIWDPAETIELLVELQPAATENSTNIATVAVPNGVTAEVVFGH
jgi:hypothetical protein